MLRQVSPAEAHPHIQPDQYVFTSKEIWLGGQITLSRVVAWTIRVRRELLDSLSEAGHEVPNEGASIFEGDDDLPWPAERLRYHWSIPQVQEHDWPRKEASNELVESLAQRFASKRARDPHD